MSHPNRGDTPFSAFIDFINILNPIFPNFIFQMEQINVLIVSQFHCHRSSFHRGWLIRFPQQFRSKVSPVEATLVGSSHSCATWVVHFIFGAQKWRREQNTSQELQILFWIFNPNPWGNDPTWRDWRAYFSNGLVQPATIIIFVAQETFGAQTTQKRKHTWEVESQVYREFFFRHFQPMLGVNFEP